VGEKNQVPIAFVLAGGYVGEGHPQETVAALAAKGRGLAGDATEEDGELAERSWICAGREL
jgi:hypothetical protein